MQQGIMGSHASPDLWISAKKNPRSAELRRTFCDAEFRRKKISRNPRENHWISRSPLHILWCWVLPNHRSEYKVPPKKFFFSRGQIHNFCSGVPPKNKKNKVRKKNATDSGAQDLNFTSIFRRFFSSRSQTPPMPHNRPQRKKGPQSPQRFVWQTNLRLQSKVLSPRPYPTYWPWVAHVIGRNLPG